MQRERESERERERMREISSRHSNPLKSKGAHEIADLFYIAITEYIGGRGGCSKVPKKV